MEIDQEYITCQMCQCEYRIRIINGEPVMSSCSYCGFDPNKYQLFGVSVQAKRNTILFKVRGIRR